MLGIIGIVLIFFFLVVKGKGAVTGAEILRFNEGDSVAQLGNIFGVKPLHIRLLQKRNNWNIVYQYCAPGEEQKGCLNITSPRISARIVYENVFIDLHNVTASDAGFYIFDVTGGNQRKETKEKRFHVTVERLEIFSSTESPPSNVTTPNPTNGPTQKIIIIILFIIFLVAECIFCTKGQELLAKNRSLLSILQSVRSLIQPRHTPVSSTDCGDEATSNDSTTSDNKTEPLSTLLKMPDADG